MLLRPIAYIEIALQISKRVEIYIDHLSPRFEISVKDVKAGIQLSSALMCGTNPAEIQDTSNRMKRVTGFMKKEYLLLLLFIVI